MTRMRSQVRVLYRPLFLLPPGHTRCHIPPKPHGFGACVSERTSGASSCCRICCSPHRHAHPSPAHAGSRSARAPSGRGTRPRPRHSSTASPPGGSRSGVRLRAAHVQASRPEYRRHKQGAKAETGVSAVIHPSDNQSQADYAMRGRSQLRTRRVDRSHSKATLTLEVHRRVAAGRAASVPAR